MEMSIKFKIHIATMYIYMYVSLDANCTNVSNFHPLEVVGHSSETRQLQVGENLLL